MISFYGDKLFYQGKHEKFIPILSGQRPWQGKQGRQEQQSLKVYNRGTLNAVKY